MQAQARERKVYQGSNEAGESIKPRQQREGPTRERATPVSQETFNALTGECSIRYRGSAKEARQRPIHYGNGSPREKGRAQSDENGREDVFKVSISTDRSSMSISSISLCKMFRFTARTKSHMDRVRLLATIQ
jgi:hypothetical protein